jgi:hypothetical protein
VATRAPREQDDDDEHERSTSPDEVGELCGIHLSRILRLIGPRLGHGGRLR